MNYQQLMAQLCGVAPDAEYMLYPAASRDDLYHLGEKGISGLHLVDATAEQVIEFASQQQQNRQPKRKQTKKEKMSQSIFFELLTQDPGKLARIAQVIRGREELLIVQGMDRSLAEQGGRVLIEVNHAVALGQVLIMLGQAIVEESKTPFGIAQ